MRRQWALPSPGDRHGLARGSVVVRRAHGGDGGDEDVGEHWAGDPVGSQRADERGIGNRNVRWAERRAEVDDGDWKLQYVSTWIVASGRGADEVRPTG